MKRSAVREMGLFFLLATAFLLRAAFPTADPPKNLSNSRGIFLDGPKNVHNARNLALTGTFRLDDGWNPFCYSPSFTWATYLAFKTFGAGLWQARMYPILCSVLSILLVYAVARKEWGEGAAFLSAAFLGLDFTTISYGRLAMFETPMVAVMLLAVYAWQKGREDGAVWLVISGVCLGLSFVAKSIAAYFVGVFLAFSFFHALQLSRFRPSRSLARPLYILSGLTAVMLLWLLFFFLPNRSWVGKIGSGWLELAMSGGLVSWLRNAFRFSAFWHLCRSLPLLLLAIWGIFKLFFAFLESRGASRPEVDPLALLCALWFVGGGVFLSSLTYRPLRYFVALTPPLCLLAAWTAKQLWNNRKPSTGSFPAFLSSFLYFVAVSWLVYVSWLDPLLAGRTGGISPKIPTWLVRGAIAAGLSFLCGSILFAFSALAVRLASRSGRKACWPRRAAVLLAGGAFLSVQGHLYWDWAAHREYGVRDGSRALARLPHAVIAGRAANAACIENAHRPVCVTGWWDVGLVDEHGRDLFDRYPITHLQMTTQLWGVVPWFFRHYPEALSRCRFEQGIHFDSVDYPVYALTPDQLLGPTPGTKIRLEAETQFYHVGKRTFQGDRETLRSDRDYGFLLLTVPFLPRADSHRFDVLLRGKGESATIEVRRDLDKGPPLAQKTVSLEEDWRAETLVAPDCADVPLVFLALFVSGQGQAEVDFIEIKAY